MEGETTKIDRQDEMPLMDHLDELRKALAKSALAFVLSCFLIVAFLKPFADWLYLPLTNVLSREGLELSGLITTSPFGVFTVIFQVTLLGGFCLSFPFMLYFALGFVAPGLTQKEKKIILPGMASALLLFLTGAAFSFFVLVPAALKASAYFNEFFNFQVFWSADRYYALLAWMVLGIGGVFEFPLILVVMVYIGFLKVEQLRQFRSYSIILFLGIAAVITPTTDPFTFLLLAVPMSVLYELSIFVSARLERFRSSD